MAEQDVIETYRKRAKSYDFTANLYYLIGYPEFTYRRIAVDALGLHSGDTVVEIGCGTGLNFPYLEQVVGPRGKIIGVNLTGAMLAQARQRVEKNHWANVELVQSDASQYTFPQGVDGILSTFAITLAPEYDLIIKNGAQVLAQRQRFVVCDLKMPENLPGWLKGLAFFITRPFAVTREQATWHPWESIKKYLPHYSYREFYFGFTYLAVGETVG